MKSVVVIQARTSSSRLPAKVLLPVKNIPLVVLAAKRAANTGREVIVATSVEPSDDALVLTLQHYKIPYHRGSLKNTLDRIVSALAAFDDETVVIRLTADNVFPDGALLDEIEENFLATHVQYLCCNGIPSGLPYGMSAEISKLTYLREAADADTTVFEKEHVTPYIVNKYGAHFFEKYKALDRGRWRCTVDSFDDYIAIQKVFETVDDPVAISSLDLIEKLENTAYNPTNNEYAPKLVFGTAQLGMNYGIANVTGQPAPELCTDLLKTAVSHGVQHIDTARAYGNSEQMVGRFLSDGWQGRALILTKLSPLTSCPADASAETVRAFVDASVYESCASLGVEYLEVLMLHRTSHFREWQGAVWIRLLELQESSVIKKFGVSVQSPEELQVALDIPEVCYIQMPCNILDWRWRKSIQVLRDLRVSRKLVIHVRSVLLQGLLPSQDSSCWEKANLVKSEAVQQWLVDQVQHCGRVDISDLCINYVKGLDWVDGVVVGMETKKQLLDNISHFNRPALRTAEIEKINSNRPKLGESTLNPALWRNE